MPTFTCRVYLVLREHPATPAKMENLVYKDLLDYPEQVAHAASADSLVNAGQLVHPALLANVALSA